jgi:hypothetical protein
MEASDTNSKFLVYHRVNKIAVYIILHLLVSACMQHATCWLPFSYQQTHPKPSLSHGYTYFPNIYGPPRNSGCQKGHMKQAPHWGPTNTGRANAKNLVARDWCTLLPSVTMISATENLTHSSMKAWQHFMLCSRVFHEFTIYSVHLMRHCQWTYRYAVTLGTVTKQHCTHAYVQSV